MSNVIAVVNQKGGTGKTTTALNLAAGLLRYSDITSSCLIIDMDPSGCASATMLGTVDTGAPQRSIFDVLRRAITPHDGIMSTVFSENIDILPSSPHLASMAKTQILDRLKKVTEALASSYGWIIIDTPPNLGVLTTNAIVCADYVLIPSPINGLSVGTLKQLAAHIDHVRSNQNDLLQVLGILVTMKDARTKLNEKLVKEVKEIFGKEAIFKTEITTNTKLEEAPGEFQSIFSYDSSCVGAAMYRDFLKKELLKKLKSLEKKRAGLIEAKS
jgi:chromosome partitioning protein